MGKKIYVLEDVTDGVVVAASDSKEKMVDYAVDYILDVISSTTDILENEMPDDLDDDEYEEEFERVENEYKEKIRTWATDLVNGRNEHHYSDDFSLEFQVWISTTELI